MNSLKTMLLSGVLATLFVFSCQENFEMPKDPAIDDQRSGAHQGGELPDDEGGGKPKKITPPDDGDGGGPGTTLNYTAPRNSDVPTKIITKARSSNLIITYEPSMPTAWVNALKEAVRRWNTIRDISVFFNDPSPSSNPAPYTTHFFSADVIENGDTPIPSTAVAATSRTYYMGEVGTEVMPANELVVVSAELYNTSYSAERKAQIMAHELVHVLGFSHNNSSVRWTDANDNPHGRAGNLFKKYFLEGNSGTSDPAWNDWFGFADQALLKDTDTFGETGNEEIRINHVVSSPTSVHVSLDAIKLGVEHDHNYQWAYKALNGNWINAGSNSAHFEGFITQALNFEMKVTASGAETRFKTEIIPVTSVPSTPWSLNSSVNGNSVYLTWYPIINASSYVVQLDGVTKPAVTYPNASYSNLSSGTHSWRVKGVNQHGSGSYSPSFTFYVDPPASTKPPTPSNFRLTAVSAHQVTLFWDKVTSANYQIQIETTPDPFPGNQLYNSIKTISNSNTTSYPTALTHYSNGVRTGRWRIRSTNANGTSAWSAWLTTTGNTELDGG
ncbi:hypothetical protein [Reichenbachiella sp.]|uniref:hypothetical protein n=1 Tax=Reichenbachiella sp. TaxID=2184521 RepID=UPI00329951EF